jgi:hypothetical protein
LVLLNIINTSLFSISLIFLLYQSTHQIYSNSHLFLSSLTLSRLFLSSYFLSITKHSQNDSCIRKSYLFSIYFFNFLVHMGGASSISYIDLKFSWYYYKLKYNEKNVSRKIYIRKKKLINLQDVLSRLQIIAKDKKTRTTHH